MERIRKRRVWLACLLAIFQLGLGFIYVGQPWGALAWPFVLPALALLGRVTGIALMPWGMPIVVGLFLATWLGSVIWCGWAANRAGEVALARYQRWYVYVAYSVVAYLMVSYLGSAALFDWTGVRLYRIPSASMNDTLLLNDYIITDSWAYRWGHKPGRGDIVVVNFPSRGDIKVVKRVVGLPGERIELRKGRLYINDRQLDEPYVNPKYNVHSTEDDWRYEIPAQRYFLLGDNRDASEDSRWLGFVPAERISGRVCAISPSFDSAGRIYINRAGRL